MTHHTPTSLDQVWPLLAGASGEDRVSIIAGGTDFYPALGDRAPPGQLLDLGQIPQLHGITHHADHWRIGAGTTWTQVIAAPLPGAFDGLKAAAAEVGAVQIQNVATLVGNLCNASPAADGVPPLLTLDAVVELSSAVGTRLLPLDAFLLGARQTALGPDEVVTALRIPHAPDAAQGSFVKLGARRYLVISAAMVAALVWQADDGSISSARVAVGACSAVAQRMPLLERSLIGLRSEDIAHLDISAAHLTALTPIDDIRGSAAYRADAVRTLIRSALTRTLVQDTSANG